MEPMPRKLGSLAQGARIKHLNSARNYLLLVFVLQMVGGLFLVYAFSQVNIPKEALPQVYLAYGVVFGAGLAFLVLALLVYRFPLPATIIGLVLFITLHAIDAIADPTSLARGWLIKILVIAALVKAIQAAVAYENERKATMASNA